MAVYALVCRVCLSALLVFIRRLWLNRLVIIFWLRLFAGGSGVNKKKEGGLLTMNLQLAGWLTKQTIIKKRNIFIDFFFPPVESAKLNA